MTSPQTPEAQPTPGSENLSSEQVSSFWRLAKTKKVRNGVLIAGSAAGLVGLGSTLASNISLNNGSNVEFGQGVQKTTACDADGFTVTPVAEYDSAHSIFRLDHVAVTGLNLTPVGTGWNDADLNGTYGDQASAKNAHPGEYYDTNVNQWVRTCDGVVLDFKAYTDDQSYWTATRDGYWSNNQNIATPVGWIQQNGNFNRSGNNDIGNFGFSVIFDIYDNPADGYDSNYGTDGTTWGWVDQTSWRNLNFDTPANSSFDFGDYWDSNYRPDAASISKIAVASMATFNPDYYLSNGGGLGTN